MKVYILFLFLFLLNIVVLLGVSMCSTYKNNFNLKEPISGNINSGEDDNVEALTGNDVGTE